MGWIHWGDSYDRFFTNQDTLPGGGFGNLTAAEIQRLWLHQTNLSMNQLIARKVYGRDPAPDETPVTLAEFANTSSAGSIADFHKHSGDLQVGDCGVICSFGAGYSVGSIMVKKI